MYVQLDCYLLLLLDSCIYSLVYFWTLFDGSSGVCLMICSTFICISFISMNKVLIQCIDAHPIAAYRTKNHSIISRGGKGPKKFILHNLSVRLKKGRISISPTWFSCFHAFVLFSNLCRFQQREERWSGLWCLGPVSWDGAYWHCTLHDLYSESGMKFSCEMMISNSLLLISSP